MNEENHTRHIMFDIETLDVESTAVILSVAMIPFKLNEKYGTKATETYPSVDEYWGNLIRRSIFVKFDAREQIDNYKRTVNKPTLAFWNKQCDIVKAKSFLPNKEVDVSTELGVNTLYKHIQNLGLTKDSRFWARGTLDQVCFDSLCRKLGKDPIIGYNHWMDVRTAISFLYDDASSGYRTIPGFEKDSKVMKHDPVQDCAYDILQLIPCVD